MQADQDAIQRINAVKYLYMRSIKEPVDNQLEIYVEQAVPNEEKRGLVAPPGAPPELAHLFLDVAPVETLPGCLGIRLRWSRYAAYQVTEQYVGNGGVHDDEAFEGSHLRVYSKSHFLDHLARNIGVHAAPLLHFKIMCENHLIDVASEQPPTIELTTL